MKRTHSELPPGLSLHLDFITEAEEQELILAIDKRKWSTEIKRRVQHFGARYDYKTKKLHFDVEGLPPEGQFITDRFMEQKLCHVKPNQLIVNEYIKGQGISAHTDRTDVFGPEIASLSLLSACTMIFKRQGNVCDLELPPRSLLMLTGDARYKWTHEIQNVAEKRISFTFRTQK